MNDRHKGPPAGEKIAAPSTAAAQPAGEDTVPRLRVLDVSLARRRHAAAHASQAPRWEPVTLDASGGYNPYDTAPLPAKD
jgi:hypothetical protein